jgi:hypothetical protein
MAISKSLERFNMLLEEQVRSQEAEVASIERQMIDIETTNREVQPLMAADGHHARQLHSSSTCRSCSRSARRWWTT